MSSSSTLVEARGLCTGQGDVAEGPPSSHGVHHSLWPRWLATQWVVVVSIDTAEQSWQVMSEERPAETRTAHTVQCCGQILRREDERVRTVALQAAPVPTQAHEERSR